MVVITITTAAIAIGVAAAMASVLMYIRNCSGGSTLNDPTPLFCWKYNVFLSFRGTDTRKTFVDHLYTALVQRLTCTYKDDETLERGDTIGPSLLKAIEESQIAVIIFSKNYANSAWCLDELAHIMKCMAERRQTVIPIFYDVEPSEVRHQKGEFGKAFAKVAKNTKGKKVKSWRKALVDASNIAGWEPKHIANGHEAKCIQHIVENILDKLSSNSVVYENLVGIRILLHDTKSQLKIGSGDMRIPVDESLVGIRTLLHSTKSQLKLDQVID